MEGIFKYSKNKWTLKELLEHLTDCEKIFNYRTLRFSKIDQTELSGFDENLYVSNGNASNQPLELLIEEFKLIRLSSIYFFRKLSDEELTREGISNGNLFLFFNCQTYCRAQTTSFKYYKRKIFTSFSTK